MALLVGLATLALSSTSLQATVLLNDTFTNSTRSNQNLPNSAHWYAGGGGSSLIVTNNTLRLLTDAIQRQTVVYFTDSGTQTLGIGDSLSISFSLTASNYAAGADLRFGLFNSGGNRVDADNLGNSPTNGVYAEYEGYALISNFGTATNGSTLRARTGTTNSLFSTSAGVFTTLSGSTWGIGHAFTNDETYLFTLTITADSATNTSLNFLMKDSTNATLIDFTTIDTTSLYNKFDTFAFLSGGSANSAGSAVFLDNALVTYTPVPESNALGIALPGTLALGLALFLGHRRRKDAASA